MFFFHNLNFIIVWCQIKLPKTSPYVMIYANTIQLKLLATLYGSLLTRRWNMLHNRVLYTLYLFLLLSLIHGTVLWLWHIWTLIQIYEASAGMNHIRTLNFLFPAGCQLKYLSYGCDHIYTVEYIWFSHNIAHTTKLLLQAGDAMLYHFAILLLWSDVDSHATCNVTIRTDHAVDIYSILCVWWWIIQICGMSTPTPLSWALTEIYRWRPNCECVKFWNPFTWVIHSKRNILCWPRLVCKVSQLVINGKAIVRNCVKKKKVIIVFTILVLQLLAPLNSPVHRN